MRLDSRQAERASRVETVLNSVLIAAFIGSAVWAALAPSFASVSI